MEIFFFKITNKRKDNSTPEKLAIQSKNSMYLLGIHKWDTSKKKPRLKKNKNNLKKFLSEYAKNPKVLVNKYDKKWCILSDPGTVESSPKKIRPIKLPGYKESITNTKTLPKKISL